MDFAAGMLKNRNYIFFAVLGLVVVLFLFSYQRSITQQATFIKDRQLYAASVQSFKQGNYQGALEQIQKTSPPFQQDWNYYYLLGSIQLMMGNYAEADSYFQRTEEITPMVLTLSEFLLKRGQVFIRLGQKDEALDYLSHASAAAESEKERQLIESMIAEAKSLP